MSNPPPLSNGRYTLSDTLGEGGMATVYGGFDTMLEVERAVKVLSPALCSSEKLRRRFLAEARAMAKLRHPNIVTVFDVGVDGQTPYIVMEKVDGGSVMGLVERDGAQPPEVAGHIVLAALAGLQASHESGVIHRDMKLHNLLISTSGEIKITDFGIAQLGGEQSHTKTGAIMGTLAYMPPEQRQSAKGLGPTADVFACGASLFALLSGREPFDVYNESLHDKLFAGIPTALRRVIVRACQYEAEERYPTAESMAVDLRDAMTDLGIAIDPNLKVPVGENQVPLFEPIERAASPPSEGLERRDSTTINPKDTWFTTHGERAQDQPFATEPEQSSREASSKATMAIWIVVTLIACVAALGVMLVGGDGESDTPATVTQSMAGNAADSPVQPVAAPEPPVAAPEPPVAAPEPPIAAPEPPVAAPEPPVAAPEPPVAAPPNEPVQNAKSPPVASPKKPQPKAEELADSVPTVADSNPAQLPPQQTTLVLRAIPPISVVFLDGQRLNLINNTVTTAVKPGSRELKFGTEDGLYGSTQVVVPAGESLKACFRFIDRQLKKC